MDTREFKGLELAARSTIEQRQTYWYVPSTTQKGGYRVDYAATNCTCEDYELRQLPCKHIFAVRFVKERNRGKPLPEQPAADEGTPLTPPPTKPICRQNWPLYNAAQTNEKRLFLILLADLCQSIVYVPRAGRGRPRVPLPDAIFAAVYKVYSTVSGRRFTSDLIAAQEAGHIAHAPHYNSIFRVLEDADTSTTLKQLVVRSSLPLKAVETQYAVDSSGFSTSRFERWFDQKYGVTRKKADWVKCHLMCGVKTNVVTAVEVNDSGDATMYRPLAETTARNFTIEEISADKAYSSYANLEFTDTLGAKPFIPFKAGSRGDTRPGPWERMFHYFSLNREEFLKHYHKRSNVESTFSMMKAKFGDAVRSKTDTAMTNEVLCKVVCHNVCCLIHEMYELGITPTFGTEGEEPPAILRFPAR